MFLIRSKYLKRLSLYSHMSDKKTEEIKQKLEETDQKVKGKLKEVEQSPIGKALPMEIRGLTLYHIIKYLGLFILYIDMAIYLQIQAKDMAVNKGFFKKVSSKLFLILFYIFGCVGDLFCFVTFLMKLKDTFKFKLVFKCVKVVLTLIIMFLIASKWYNIMTAMLFGGIACFLDLIFIYYVAMFYERLDSDDFDAYGSPLQKEEVIEIKENEPPKEKA
ncbi:hypothetical protein H312_01670 [Anncaliia algerae PRA339]|uniref:Uncharacterized protein n=1 Tax=Anncaliia algerae PRA339 TaxID=1288291 RepID=A0A059F1B0_9MICR|nr:hypothetical protein H312_01670 [Anncaliia algerae PRA339]